VTERSWVLCVVGNVTNRFLYCQSAVIHIKDCSSSLPTEGGKRTWNAR
jgi:hypothetical protein